MKSYVYYIGFTSFIRMSIEGASIHNSDSPILNNGIKIDLGSLKKSIEKKEDERKILREELEELYNNSLEIEKYYKGYSVLKREKFVGGKQEIEEILHGGMELLKVYQSGMAQQFLNDGVGVLKNSQYRQVISEHRILQREFDNRVIDMNAPMQLYDLRIIPTEKVTLLYKGKNKNLVGDQVTFLKYDTEMLKQLLDKYDKGTYIDTKLINKSTNTINKIDKEEVVIDDKEVLIDNKEKNEYQGLVDYLIEHGMKYKLEDRKKLASSFGLENYTGGEGENILLLSLLKNKKETKHIEKKQKVDKKKELILFSKEINKKKSEKKVIKKGITKNWYSQFKKDGEFILERVGVPNIAIIYKRNNEGSLIPNELINKEGKRIPYEKWAHGKKFPIGFQYGGYDID